MVAYDKVGYLRAIVRFHIKAAHPKRHPTTYKNRGLHRLLTSGPHLGAREPPPKRLCDSLYIISKIKLGHGHLYSFYWVRVNISGV